MTALAAAPAPSGAAPQAGTASFQAPAAHQTAPSQVRALTPSADSSIRVKAKLRKRPRKAKKVHVVLSTRVSGKARYTARVSFGSDRKARLKLRSYDSHGQKTAKGASRIILKKVRPKKYAYLELQAVERSGGTLLRVRAWTANKPKKRVYDRMDTAAGRPTQAGTSKVAVSRSKRTTKPRVRVVSVSQPTPTPVDKPTPPTPASLPVPSTGPALPPNPNSGHGGWVGRVSRVIDGDTIDVVLDGSSKTVQVRNAGIQAMETGQCHGASASAAMSALTPAGSRVLLTARYASSTSTVGGVVRLLRFIYVLKDGKWVDTQLALLQKGEVLWYPIPPEYTNSAKYREAMERASAAKSGMFAPARSCGTLSETSVPRIWINYDGDGDENAVVNSEYIRLHNPSSAQVDLSNWWIRDGSQRHANIPSGTVIKPGGTLTLYVGKGTDSPSKGRLYWGWNGPRFQNTIYAPTGRRVSNPPGNTAYLFDPRGNVRALTTYPCVTCGSHPLRGKVKLTAQPVGGDETTAVRNVSSGPIDLSFQVLQARGSIYEIRPGTVLAPGEALTVHMRTGTPTRLVQHWGKQAEYNLPDSGSEMRLRSVRDVEAACVAWGSGAC